MKSQVNCPLCSNEASKIREVSEVLDISCPSCGDFKITQECLEDLPSERKLLPQLMKVSAFTRYRTINKEPVATLFISDPYDYSEGFTIQQIVDQFPSLAERKLKVMQNLNQLSEYFGQKLSFDSKDYAVFFPEVKDEHPCLMMIQTLIDEGLIMCDVKFPTQITVTDKGSSISISEATSVPSQVPKTQVIEGPELNKLKGLHPRVLEMSQEPFRDGYFRPAVLDTYLALDNDVRIKSKLDLYGSALMQKAFSEKAPILKIKDGSAQMGAMWLFSGSTMSIRNVLAHDHSIIPSEQEALEQLFFASMLFRKLDLAVNVDAEKLITEISQITFNLDGKYDLNKEKIREYLNQSKEFVDRQLHVICFEKILTLIKSMYFGDQNFGIKLILTYNDMIFNHITNDDHIDLIITIYKAAGDTYPSHSAMDLIKDNFSAITKSFRIFQERLLSNTEVFNELLNRIWLKDAFFTLIIKYSDVEFMRELLTEIVDKKIVLAKRDLDLLSGNLNDIGRNDFDDLTKKVAKMNQ
ncbi:TIGR02391 family protein [Paenibacillus sp. CFBP13512]|uniref:TIGR02391 family protein n=1 Tax=Paenibacillus sp. CFBP13512 TaxID=2184007 RepID=UPI001375F371|nr:TIGR02391 family protein [Paenibacillus sp. CFBP13512]